MFCLKIPQQQKGVDEVNVAKSLELLNPNNEIWGLLFCSLHFYVYLEIFHSKKLLKPINTNEEKNVTNI